MSLGNKGKALLRRFGTPGGAGGGAEELRSV